MGTVVFFSLSQKVINTHIEWKLSFFPWGYNGRNVNLASYRDQMQMSRIIVDIYLMCADVVHRDLNFYLQFRPSLAIAKFLHSYYLALQLSSPEQRANHWSGTTCLFTPSSRVFLEKLTGFQLDKKFPSIYRTRKFITAFTQVPANCPYPEADRSSP